MWLWHSTENLAIDGQSFRRPGSSFLPHAAVVIGWILYACPPITGLSSKIPKQHRDTVARAKKQQCLRGSLPGDSEEHGNLTTNTPNLPSNHQKQECREASRRRYLREASITLFSAWWSWKRALKAKLQISSS